MRRVAWISLMVLAFANASVAEDALVTGVGDWEIFQHSNDGKDCFMRKRFDDGLTVEAGFLSEKNGAFFAVYHPDWTDINVGETVFIAFHFGDVGFGGDVEAVETNGMKGGYAFFDNPAFTDELARRDVLTITGPEGDKTDVALSGTSRAIAAVRECQNAR